MPTPVISVQLIRHVVGPTDSRTILWDAPIGRYIRGGRPAIRAFANVLNRSAEFRGYGLDLTPGDLARC